MAKPVIKFSTVAFSIGNFTGFRPVLEGQDGKYDLDFCTEVVNEKRLAMSPDELLHAMMMVSEVGPAKVAEDGRPRGITKLLKWNRFPQGKLDSPTSPWNDSCKVLIRPQLMTAAEKRLDATFVNVNQGLRVRLDNVTWIGAKNVQNVIKPGADIGANGMNMQFDAALGDTATLTYDQTVVNLTSKGSDVSRVVFAYPDGLAALEAGTQLVFEMKSRGGVPDGDVHTVRKTVTLIASDTPPEPESPRAKLVNLSTSDADAPGELSVDDGVKLTFDKIDPDGATGHVVVNGVEQPAPVTVTETEPWVMWTWGEDLVGQTVTFGFRYEDGTEAGTVTKTIRARRS